MPKLYPENYKALLKDSKEHLNKCTSHVNRSENLTLHYSPKSIYRFNETAIKIPSGIFLRNWSQNSQESQGTQNNESKLEKDSQFQNILES